MLRTGEGDGRSLGPGIGTLAGDEVVPGVRQRDCEEFGELQNGIFRR